MNLLRRFHSFFRVVAAMTPAAVFLGLWEWWASGNSTRIFLFSTPTTVALIAISEILDGNIFYDLLLTASETIVGLTIGSILGTCLGLTSWTSDGVGRVVRPYITIAGSIPVFALAPMLIMWFGTGFLAKVVMAAFPTFLIAVVQAFEGAQAANEHLLRVGHTFRATRLKLLLKVVLPGALAWVMAGFRMNAGFALVGAFIGEFIVAERGLGRYILKAGGLYDIPRVLFGIALLGCVALLLNGLVGVAERTWFPWLRAQRQDGPKMTSQAR